VNKISPKTLSLVLFSRKKKSFPFTLNQFLVKKTLSFHPFLGISKKNPFLSLFPKKLKKKDPFLSPLRKIWPKTVSEFPFLFPVKEITKGADPSRFIQETEEK